MSAEVARQHHEHPWRRTGLNEQDAQDLFDRARRRASWARLAGWLRGRPSSRNRLPVLGEVPIATGTGGAVHGVQRLEFERVGPVGPASQVMVPIDQIVGTAEPRTFFDRCFRPTCEVPRARFEWLAAAVLSGRGIEPVELYHCDGRYYVLDGNHRIAVARALGERSVCANVTEVRLNKPGKPIADAAGLAAWDGDHRGTALLGRYPPQALLSRGERLIDQRVRRARDRAMTILGHGVNRPASGPGVRVRGQASAVRRPRSGRGSRHGGRRASRLPRPPRRASRR